MRGEFEKNTIYSSHTAQLILPLLKPIKKWLITNQTMTRFPKNTVILVIPISLDHKPYLAFDYFGLYTFRNRGFDTLFQTTIIGASVRRKK
jgi:hypothetical protein